MNSWHCVSPSY